jgi:hypothetical protein
VRIRGRTRQTGTGKSSGLRKDHAHSLKEGTVIYAKKLKRGIGLIKTGSSCKKASSLFPQQQYKEPQSLPGQ